MPDPSDVWLSGDFVGLLPDEMRVWCALERSQRGEAPPHSSHSLDEAIQSEQSVKDECDCLWHNDHNGGCTAR